MCVLILKITAFLSALQNCNKDLRLTRHSLVPLKILCWLWILEERNARSWSWYALKNKGIKKEKSYIFQICTGKWWKWTCSSMLHHSPYVEVLTMKSLHKTYTILSAEPNLDADFIFSLYSCHSEMLWKFLPQSSSLPVRDSNIHTNNFHRICQQ